MVIKVLYEDETLIVVEKPAGVESQSAGTFSRDMVSEIKNYLRKKQKAGEPYVGVVHRLDKPVFGVMVYGKTKEAAAALSRQVQADAAKTGSDRLKRMEKYYYALVCGQPSLPKGILADNLCFDRKANLSYVVEETEKKADVVCISDMKQAVLEYEVVPETDFTGFDIYKNRILNNSSYAYSGQYTLLRIHLLTGRHHQIRVQLSHAGFPVLGDTKYNPYMKEYRGPSSLCLCAFQICFTHPVTGERLEMKLA